MVKRKTPLAQHLLLLILFWTACILATDECQQQGNEDTCTAPTTTASADPIRTVLVTGSNGYVASWIVKELLERDYTVHAAVRDATDPAKVDVLKGLDPTNGSRLKFFSTGDLGTADESVWDAPLQNCQAVIHVSMSMNWFDGEAMYQDTLHGTHQLLRAVQRHSSTVQSLVLTSSIAAVESQPYDKVTNETHWRKAEEDLELGSYYSATKIAQEKFVTEWVEKEKEKGTLPNNFQFASIVPTRVIGPPISTQLPVDGWLKQVKNWILHPTEDEPDEVIEFVHVQDVAVFHIAALQHREAYGRYLCVDESWHFTDFIEYLEHLVPGMPRGKLYYGFNPIAPMDYSFERRDTLEVEFRSMKDLLKECVEYLKQQGELDDVLAKKEE